MEDLRLYPVGIQTFSEIREGNFLYVDKTDLIYKLIKRYKYVFLSRPRRFGKSLLTSTLKSYFEGRKDLFEGLAIDELEKDWKKFPVLHFSMFGGKHMDVESLNSYIDTILSKMERIYGKIPGDNKKPNDRFAYLIEQAYEQTGQKVVVLIDEYDAPLHDTAVDNEEFNQLRKIMRNFYSPLKDADPYLRFVFLTGITKFSQVSIFSELNNIEDISMEDDFATICGFTKDEILTQFEQDIDELADYQKMNREETIAELTRNYDGYHFSIQCPDIFNPFSMLRCFKKKVFDYYWYSTGTPTILVEQMQKCQILPTELGGEIKASITMFDTSTENLDSIYALLYQSGYLTIKDYDRYSRNYKLGIPNTEVRVGLMYSLIPNYLRNKAADMPINEIAGLLRTDVRGAFDYLKQYFKTVPYCDNIDYEGHWQQMLYVIFSLLGAHGDVEVHTSDGRVDLALMLYGKIYIMEIKIDGTAQEAIQQINNKDYISRFTMMNKPIIKIGINFSTKERTITEYIIEG